MEKKITKSFKYVVNLGGYVDHSNKKKTFESHYLGCKNLADILNVYKMNNLDYVLKKYKDPREINSLIPFLKNDKKNNDEKINFILINRIGKTTMPNKHKVSIFELKKYIKNLTQY